MDEASPELEPCVLQGRAEGGVQLLLEVLVLAGWWLVLVLGGW